jgi:hypothetical protein
LTPAPGRWIIAPQLPRGSANRHVYVHPAIGDEIRAIGGGYTTARESVIAVEGRDLLYAIVVARVDASCCGEGGCLYANVIGYLVAPASGPGGERASEVEPIGDAEAQARLARLVRGREQVHEVRFWSPDG